MNLIDMLLGNTPGAPGHNLRHSLDLPMVGVSMGAVDVSGFAPDSLGMAIKPVRVLWDFDGVLVAVCTGNDDLSIAVRHFGITTELNATEHPWSGPWVADELVPAINALAAIRSAIQLSDRSLVAKRYKLVGIIVDKEPRGAPIEDQVTQRKPLIDALLEQSQELGDMIVRTLIEHGVVAAEDLHYQPVGTQSYTA